MNNVDVHKIIMPLVHATKHFHNLNVADTECNYHRGDCKITVSKDEYETYISIRYGENKFDFINIGFRENKTIPISQYLYSNISKRNRLILKGSPDKVYIDTVQIDGNSVKDISYTIPINATEEELFQISTVEDIPSTELIQEIKDVFKLYDFLKEDEYIRVSFFADNEILKDDKKMQYISGLIWRLVNV